MLAMTCFVQKMLNKLLFSPMTLFGKRHRNDHFDVHTRQCGQLHIVREKMTNCKMVYVFYRMLSRGIFAHWPWVCGQRKIFCFIVPYRCSSLSISSSATFLIMMDGNAFWLVIAHIITNDRQSESIGTTTFSSTFSEWMLKQFTVIVMWWLLVTKGAKPLIIDSRA